MSTSITLLQFFFLCYPAVIFLSCSKVSHLLYCYISSLAVIVFCSPSTVKAHKLCTSRIQELSACYIDKHTLASNPVSSFRILSRSFGDFQSCETNPEWRAWVLLRLPATTPVLASCLKHLAITYPLFCWFWFWIAVHVWLQLKTIMYFGLCALDTYIHSNTR